jgi:hypothetical protein
MREWVIPALGVALSPLPVLGMLLVLGGSRPALTGAAFWLAWTIGVALPTTAFVVLAERTGASDGDSRVIALGEIAVGVAFLAVAARLLVGGRRAAAQEVRPWLEALDRSGPSRAARLAVLLSGLNPKNLALMLTGAVAIAQASADGAETFSTLGFVAIAISSVSLLYLGYAAFA